ncbi:MAG: class I SAM-dependent methyltransferase [Frankiaceae bacterium]
MAAGGQTVTQDATRPHDWDAEAYATLPLPHADWGGRALDRLRLTGGQTVLDLGCGPGRDTARLLQRLPAGRVLALDGSATMLRRARTHCSGDAKVSWLQADLRSFLPLSAGSVDAVFSVATLHWVPDHPALFREMARVLRPGGRLSLEYGGAGNVASVVGALRALGREPAEWVFARPADEEPALLTAGFTGVECRLRPVSVPMAEDVFVRYLANVVLVAQLESAAAAERADLEAAVAERMARPAVDYVRLEVTAGRAV